MFLFHSFIAFICYFYFIIMFYFSFLHFPLSGPVLTNISLPIIPCMIVYVTNNKEPWTLNLGCLQDALNKFFWQKSVLLMMRSCCNTNYWEYNSISVDGFRCLPFPIVPFRGVGSLPTLAFEVSKENNRIFLGDSRQCLVWAVIEGLFYFLFRV